MPVAGIDHIAMPTANAERLIAFYKSLGFLINNEEAWRSGNANTFSIQVGDSKINIHPEGHTASLRGPTAVPGCGDICFVWDGTVDECREMLKRANVEIIQGPVPRPGGRGRGTVPSLSIYCRDPDENLLEFMTYHV
jgi:catechol 2,3-dioxygenase-like lactoylglutathione lyase family enzyme